MKVKGFSRIPPPVSLGEWLLQPCSTQSTLVYDVEQVAGVDHAVAVGVALLVGNVASVISSYAVVGSCDIVDMP